VRQWIRFVVVGGVNTAFSYGLYAACIFAGAGYAVASAVSMLGGILFSHQTTGRLVFRSAGRGTLWKFAACYLVVYGFSVLLLKAMDAAGIDAYLAGLLVAMPAALLSFTLLKLLVFRTREGG
jgi:putative flippase GtrA